ncbi:MAG: hypothetical protein V4621_01320 [Pseudomonadota bacterium]
MDGTPRDTVLKPLQTSVDVNDSETRLTFAVSHEIVDCAAQIMVHYSQRTGQTPASRCGGVEMELRHQLRNVLLPAFMREVYREKAPLALGDATLREMFIYSDVLKDGHTPRFEGLIATLQPLFKVT